jgi:hypothetical protein
LWRLHGVKRLATLSRAMAFYQDRIYPYIVSALGNPKPIDDIRRRIVSSAHSEVLELGVGPGVNFAYYDPGKVSKIFALEPNLGTSIITSKPAIRYQFKTGQRDWPKT